MTHLLTILLLYSALIAQVALRFGGAAAWTPTLTLLVGVAAAWKFRGGIIWAAGAGLICDALSGRPLGVTMLAATLVAAAFCPSARAATVPKIWQSAGRTFLAILATEAAARLLASSVLAGPEYGAELIAAAKTAIATTLVAFSWMVVRHAGPRPGRSPAADPYSAKAAGR